jgi:hypothetical protein
MPPTATAIRPAAAFDIGLVQLKEDPAALLWIKLASKTVDVHNGRESMVANVIAVISEG